MDNDQISRANQRESADRRWEWIAVSVIMLSAAAFRFLALNDVPPGLHHDEVIIGQVAKDILRGHLAIYFTAGYGHEPLYHYTLAGMFAIIGANAFVLRLTSAFIAMLGLAMTYRFIRLIFSPLIALGTLAWMAVSLWPVFFSRVGLRGIMLPLMSTMTACFLWKALEGRGARSEERGARSKGQPLSALLRERFAGARYFALSGALLGLTLYTYQASRVFPVVFAVFALYLFAMRRSSSFIPHPSSRSFLVFFLTAAIVAAPLIVYLTIINPTAEQRIAELSGPLNKLKAGDASEVIQSTLNTLGMFTLRGDAVPIYNVSNRPVFPEPISAILFYLGGLICVWRWKQPAYALMLIWFCVSLIPAMVTPFSPNFVRTIAAWPVPFVFVGIGMVSIGQLVNGAMGRWGDRSTGQPDGHHPVTLSSHYVVVGFFGIMLIANGFLTARDYFGEWPTGDYVRFWQQATWTQAERAINADPSSTPIAATGLSIHDFDPETFDLLGVRSDVRVKWFDCRNAVLFPGGVNQWTARYLIPPFFPCDADLVSRYLPAMTVLEQPSWFDSSDPIFTLYQFNRPWSLYELLMPRTVFPPVFSGSEQFTASDPRRDLEQAYPPLEFNSLRFWGVTPYREALKAGDTIEIDSFWELTQSVAPPLKIFVHVTAPDGHISAQWDGLDVNVGTLEVGDVFIQRHRIDLPADLPTGPYRVSLGVYQPESGQRLVARVGDRAVDSIVLNGLTLVK
jgi:4-amino-4-deoxy-L-arabinose transferase-like glycosyltransferase